MKVSFSATKRRERFKRNDIGEEGKDISLTQEFSPGTGTQ